MSSEILLCSNCQGTGRATWVEYIPGHNSERIDHEETCDECEGSGRIVKRTTIVYTPYVVKK